MLLALLSPVLASFPSIDAPYKTQEAASADAAVVIGNADYFKLTDVIYADADARAFNSFLLYTRRIPGSRIALFDGGANREEILAAVTEMGAKVGRGGTLWIYFAGHGAASSTTKERMLLGTDAKADATSFDARGVRVTELERLGAAGGGHVMMVLDACYGGVGRDGEDICDGCRSGVPFGYGAAAEGRSEWAAAGPNELSGPLHGAGHGAFTYYAVGALRGWADGELDDRRDGVVTAEEASTYVARALGEAQVRGQHPKWIGDGGRELSRGVSEAGPSFGREVAPGPPVAADLSSELAELARARAAREEAERREAAITAKLEAERLRKAGEAAAALKPRATADWAVAKPEVVAGGPEGAKALELFLAMYGASEGVAEVAEARRYAATAKTWKGPRSGYRMIRVEGGSFTMGSPSTEAGRGADEGPVSATVGGYWLGTYEVTQAQWRAEMGDGPERRTAFYSGKDQGSCRASGGVSLVGADLPMVCVSWLEAVTYANRLSKRDGLKEAYRVSGETVVLVTGSDGYRLPSEAEWEYAARAGTQTVYAGTSEASEVCRHGNVGDATAEKRWRSLETFTCPDGVAGPSAVGRYAANGWGFHDMMGNAWEWTGDWYAETLAPSGAQGGSARVNRGGCWSSPPALARVAIRYTVVPANRDVNLGFRLARSNP